MTRNSKAVSPDKAGTLGETASKHQANNTTQLTLRQQRINAALTDFPEGILSFTLREICKCQNVADEVMAMRRKGFNITCELEPFITVDGVKSKIGRYRLLVHQGRRQV